LSVHCDEQESVVYVPIQNTYIHTYLFASGHKQPLKNKTHKLNYEAPLRLAKKAGGWLAGKIWLKLAGLLA